MGCWNAQRRSSLAEAALSLEAVLGVRLGGRTTAEAGPRPNDTSIRLADPADLPAAAAELTRLGFAPAMLVATEEPSSAEPDLELRWVFEPAAHPLEDRFVTLVVALDSTHPELPSLTPMLPSANWHEREVQDLFGIRFAGHPDPRTLVLHDGWPAGWHPMRKHFDAGTQPAAVDAEEFPHLEVAGEGVFEVPVGPIHAGIIEPGHFRFSSVGEVVLHLDARLFYTHRGLEKRMEGLAVSEAFLVAERICGVCSVSHGLGFCEAVEQVAAVEVPARARALRSLALELERLYNHAGDIGNLCAGAAYHYGTSAGLRIREALQQLNEQVAGNRFLRGVVVPGGVRCDLSAALAQAIERDVASASRELADLVERIENNASVIDRLDDVGVLGRKAASELGVTGVAARASGIDRDARRDHPHASFADSAAPRAHVVTEADGDVHARFQVRALEALDSARIVRELLSALPAGPLAVTLPAELPAWRVGLAAVESPRGSCLHWLRADAGGRIDRYHLRSASYANWPAVPLAAQSAIIPDFPLVNKSFELCYSCTDR
jgi:Ni,Fe-hydrogenase III large subunit/Ni,Fe-hydrogenase III component G